MDFPNIVKTENVCGGSACFLNSRFPIWTLVAYKKLGLSDDELMYNFPTITPQRLSDAWAYYEIFKDEIDNDIRENDEA